MSATDGRSVRLRELPSVDALASELLAVAGEGGWRAPTPVEAVAAARGAIEERRAELMADEARGANGARDADLLARARRRLRPSLRRVLNGTGVVIHTNLGRVPLPESAIAAVHEAAGGYCNLEMDMASGRRGSRDEHVRSLLVELTGAEDALVVNNGAAAILLAVAALARGHVVVSRGQLVEIGGGFRIPEIVAQAGARLVEVGTTNRTRVDDYVLAIEHCSAPRAFPAASSPSSSNADGGGAQTATILRVHQSNFRMLGFVEDVEIERLCALGVPVIDDLGSGALASAAPGSGGLASAASGSGGLASGASGSGASGAPGSGGLASGAPGSGNVLAEEPQVARSVAAGAALVCFSGDKLLGGPQAGIIVGRAEALAACRRHPLARALRIGRLPLAGLEATLSLYRDPQRALREIPVLAMLDVEPGALAARARRLAEAVGGEVVEAVARVGGGALPLLELPGPAVALDASGGDCEALAAALRDGDPPLVPRIAGGRVLVDPRTLSEEEIEMAIAAIGSALSRWD